MKKYIMAMLFTLIATLENAQIPLTNSDEQNLIYMIEEEKLARDVYTHLYSIYNQNPFGNIKSSEQSHMDAIGDLLTQNGTSYTLQSPGVFTNTDLQNLYNQLITQGEISAIEAYKVGATIEDVDIFDLAKFKLLTTNPNIIATYDWLICGSKNHMRAFTKKITMNGGTYTPQFITAEEYNTIISGSNGPCNFNLSSSETNPTVFPKISNTMVNDSFYLLLKEKSDVAIYSIDGKLLQKGFFSSNEKINIAQYKPGIYFVKILNNERSKIFKIIKT